MKNFISLKVAATAATVAAAALSWAGPSLASDVWLACQGTATTTPYKAAAPTDTKPSQRVLIYNDGVSQLYQYSEKRKGLDVMPTKTYSASKITWAADLSHTGGMRWEGTLDRAKMKVSIKREDNDGVMVWNEQCHPSPALTDTPVASDTTAPQATAQQ